MKYIKILLAGAVSLVTFTITAQQTSNALLSKYLQSPVHKEAIHTGREYARYQFYINEGIPYYKADSLAYGKVMFDQALHDSVRLLYDQIIDEIIGTDISGSHLLTLVKAKVAYFIIYNDSFVHITPGGKYMPAGYYQVKYNGQVQLLTKETKSMIDEVRMDEPLKRKIVTKSRHYLYLNGQYHPVAGLSAAAALLDKNNVKLKDHLKKNRKKYKKMGLGNALKEVLTYYDQLTK